MDPAPSIAFQRLARTDLHLLSVFMVIVEMGGFSAAQVSLNVGQSTISRHMSDLEARLGMRLCHRGRVGFRLTDKGQMVFEACQRLFSALENFRSEVGALRGQLFGELSLAVIDNWVFDKTSPLSPALVAFKELGPQVNINIHTLAPDEIELAVLDGRIGIGVGVFHQKRPGLAYETLCRDPLELYCAAGHPFFDPEHNIPGDLSGADYVRRGYLIEETVAPLTAKLSSTATAHQIEGVAHMILTGLYIGYLPVSYAAQWVRGNAMRSLLPERFRLQTKIEVVTRKGVAPTLVNNKFLELLRKGAADHEGR